MNITNFIYVQSFHQGEHSHMSREVGCCVWPGQGDVGLLRAQHIVTEGPGVAEAGLLLPQVPHHGLQLPVLQLVLGLERRDRVLRIVGL